MPKVRCDIGWPSFLLRLYYNTELVKGVYYFNIIVLSGFLPVACDASSE